MHPGAQRFYQAPTLGDQPHRRAFAAGQDQAIQPFQLLRRTHLAHLRAEFAQDGNVFNKRALQRQHPNQRASMTFV